MRLLLTISALFIASAVHTQDTSLTKDPQGLQSLNNNTDSIGYIPHYQHMLKRPMSRPEIHYLPLNDVNRIRISLEGAALESDLHTNSFPVAGNEFHRSKQQINLADALTTKILGRFLPGFARRNFLMYLVPATDIGFGSQIEPSGSVSDMGYGAALGINFKQMFSLQGSFVYTTSTLPSFQDSLRKQISYIPSVGTYKQQGAAVNYVSWLGSFSFKPNKYFRLEIGNGKNFLGEGYRSIFLSDNASPYPYGKITTNIWKIKYTNLYLMLSDKRDVDGFVTNKTQTKFTSIHHLSWNVTKRFNISFFESIIWQAKDTLNNRQFDLTYLNPVIFYRPVEYGLGSSDNAVIGAGFKVKIINSVSIYGNAIIDEFLLSQIRADSGWWANKYALQAGLKITEPLKIKNLYFQAEYTMARPFTWSHGSVLQNYGHMNQPLAHPLGSNFTETAFIAQYSWKRFYINETVLIYEHGADSSIANFGGDIYRSYRDRYQDYHNFLGQGLKQNVMVHRLTVGWELHAATGLRLELIHMYRKEKLPEISYTGHYFMISLRSNLFEKNVLR